MAAVAQVLCQSAWTYCLLEHDLEHVLDPCCASVSSSHSGRRWSNSRGIRNTKCLEVSGNW